MISPKLALRSGRGILVLNHHGFGNVVMSIPLLTDLCQGVGPGTPVSVLLASPAHYELLRENRLQLRPIYLSNYRGWRGLMRLRRDFRNAFDLVLAVPQVPPRLAFSLKLLLGARHVVAEADGPARWLLNGHVRKTPTKSILGSQRELLALLELASAGQPPRIHLATEEVAWSRATLNALAPTRPTRLLGVHASAEKIIKRWPAERFGEVIASLYRQFPDLTVVSFGSAEERGDSELARRRAGEFPWIDGCGRWTLRQTAAMMQSCHLMLSGDTGLMHIAAAVGTRTLSIFGPTSPARLAPVHTDGYAFRPDTACHPCYERNHGPCPCLLQVTSHQVAARAAEFLSAGLPPPKHPGA